MRCLRRALFMLVMLAAVSPNRAAASEESPSEQIGSFDHIRVLVHDISASRVAYRDGLGFSFPDPEPIVFAEGSAHDISDMPDRTYLELIGITDAEKLQQIRPWIVSFLRSQEGVHSIGLEVRSAQTMSDRLQSGGLSAPVYKLARTNPQDPPVLLVTPEMPSLPVGAIFFLEYPPRKTETEPKPIPSQPNTTEKIVAIWIVVKDLAKAANDMRALGFRLVRPLSSTNLGAEGCEFAAAQGSIVLLHANRTGPVAQFFRSRGTGVMGFTLAASDLKRARSIVQHGIGHSVATYRGWYGQSFLIPATAAAGAWIEIEQK
jgi:hypothetical protein